MARGLPNDLKFQRESARQAVAAPAQLFDAFCRNVCALLSIRWAVLQLNQETDHPGTFGNGVEIWERGIAPPFRSLLALSHETLVVDDTQQDPRFVTSHSSSGATSIRFYAGIPLFIAPDVHVGTLCLMDSSVRSLTDEHRLQVEELAQIICANLELQAAVRKASEQGSLYRLLADNSTDTIVRGNLDGVRLYISPAVRALLGYEPEELIGRKASEIVHSDDAEEFRLLMTDVREGRIDVAVSEQRQRHRNGSWVWLEAFVKLTRDESGQPNGYVASVRDVSRRKEIESRLAHSALHDPLTGLPNRALLHERLSQEVSRASITENGFALLYLDLDRFKHINDKFGHEAGDALLRMVAARFRSTIRANDTLARLGGDEFVVVQTAAGNLRAGAIRLAARLIEAASEPIDFNGMTMCVGLSVGIAFAPAAGIDVDGLLRAADRALYEAKEAGRNQYRVFEAGSASDNNL